VGFRLRCDRTISTEVRRIILRQLEVATSRLASVGDAASDEAVHDARRRLKRIRAVIRLVPASAGGMGRQVDRDLRAISDVLAPVADGQSIIQTFEHVAREDRARIPAGTISALRAGLIARSRHIDAQVAEAQVLARARRVLRADCRRVKRWHVPDDGFRDIAPGLRRSVRRARRAMFEARIHPTAAHYHQWRRRVKDHWFQVRLLEERCGNHLLAYQRRLEKLDGMLGEYHDLELLREVLVSKNLLSRPETAQCLQVIRSHQCVLRCQLQSLGEQVYRDRARRFVRWVKRLWRAEAAAVRRHRAAP
jgi:CHAD domain-containing protein